MGISSSKKHVLPPLCLSIPFYSGPFFVRQPNLSIPILGILVTSNAYLLHPVSRWTPLPVPTGPSRRLITVRLHELSSSLPPSHNDLKRIPTNFHTCHRLIPQLTWAIFPPASLCSFPFWPPQPFLPWLPLYTESTVCVDGRMIQNLTTAWCSA